MAKRKKQGNQRNPDDIAFDSGVAMVHEHPLFQPLVNSATISRVEESHFQKDETAYVTKEGSITLNKKMKLSAENVAYVIAHGLLHLAFRHFRSHAFTVQVWGLVVILLIDSS